MKFFAMLNSEYLKQKGRTVVFSDLWLRVLDVRDNLPGNIDRIRLVIETDAGRKLLVLPMEEGDNSFMETVLRGIANLTAAKASVKSVYEQLDGSL
jgi:hypothetical protein